MGFWGWFRWFPKTIRIGAHIIRIRNPPCGTSFGGSLGGSACNRVFSYWAHEVDPLCNFFEAPNCNTLRIQRNKGNALFALPASKAWACNGRMHLIKSGRVKIRSKFLYRMVQFANEALKPAHDVLRTVIKGTCLHPSGNKFKYEMCQRSAKSRRILLKSSRSVPTFLVASDGSTIRKGTSRLMTFQKGTKIPRRRDQQKIRRFCRDSAIQALINPVANNTTFRQQKSKDHQAPDRRSSRLTSRFSRMFKNHEPRSSPHSSCQQDGHAK